MVSTIYWLAWFMQPEAPAPAGGGGGGGGSGGAGPAGCLGSSGSLLMLAVMFAIFYFLLIRPQQKKAREHADMIKNLRLGDRVVTSGGLVGKITGFGGDRYVTIEVAEKVRVKVLRTNVAGKDVAPPSSDKGK